jgi:hypothetical protein
MLVWQVYKNGSLFLKIFKRRLFMAIKRTFNGRTIIKPGAYTKIVVENLSGFPLQPTGVVAIIGEAKGGEPHVLDVLSTSGIQEAKTRYKSGPIADALELLVNPSKDSRIVNGASKVIVYKTNNSAQSSLNLKNFADINQLALESKNFGADENQISVLISSGAIADSNAKLLGSISGPFTLVGGETLVLNVNGQAYTFTGTLIGSQTASDLVDDMNNVANWAPSKPVVASVSSNRIAIEIDTVALASAKLDYGFIKVETTSTIDTIIGMSGSNRGVKGSRFVTVSKDLIEEVSQELGGEVMLSIAYQGVGTSCLMDLKEVSGELKLSTTCAGASSDNLDILLVGSAGENQHTVKSLVELINTNPAYSASVVSKNPFVNASELDFYDQVEIKSVAMNINKDVKAMEDHFNIISQFVGATKLPNIFGAIATLSSPSFMSGASDGSSSNSDFANGFEAFKEERINCVVPLISKDIGPLTVDSINALAVSHALWGWSTDGKSERHVFISKLGSKEQFKDAARTAQSGYASIFGQQIRVLDKNSNLVWLDPWAQACVAAGMRAGAEVGEPLTFKIMNINNLQVLDGSWNPKKDFAEMIEAGCTISEGLDTGGFRFVVGNTTYGVDASFVWNRESVVQASGFVAYDLRYNLELVFTGNKARTGTAEAIANFIRARMTQYLQADIIVGDDLNEGLGFYDKSLRVNVEGNTALINLSITPVQGIDFILPTIYLADIRQSA